jgi:Flp pilus assembly protein TadD
MLGRGAGGAGEFREATQKYAEAVRFAPAWGALHLHWGEAFDKLGNRVRAVEQYRAARELALSDSDWQTVARYLSPEAR